MGHRRHTEHGPLDAQVVQLLVIICVAECCVDFELFWCHLIGFVMKVVMVALFQQRQHAVILHGQRKNMYENSEASKNGFYFSAVDFLAQRCSSGRVGNSSLSLSEPFALNLRAFAFLPFCFGEGVRFAAALLSAFCDDVRIRMRVCGTMIATRESFLFV